MEQSELTPEPVGSSPAHGAQQRGEGACPDALRRQRLGHTGQPQLPVGTYPRPEELWGHWLSPTCHHFEPRHRRPPSDGDGDAWASPCWDPFAETAASHNRLGGVGASMDPCGCWHCQCGVTERASSDNTRKSERWRGEKALCVCVCVSQRIT